MGQRSRPTYFRSPRLAGRTPPKAAVHLIWAQALTLEGKPGAIGERNRIPWHVGEDLRHFKHLTSGHPLIMGSRTWESLGGRPLPRRENIVVSHDPAYKAPGARGATSLRGALRLARTPRGPHERVDRSGIWVIGGASILRQCLPLADDAYVTEVDVRVRADRFAPPVGKLADQGLWRLEEKGEWRLSTPQRQGGRRVRYRFLIYQRVEKAGAAGWALPARSSRGGAWRSLTQ